MSVQASEETNMRCCMLFLVAVALVLNAAAASAALDDQCFKLLPDDGAEEDYFGTCVAISGTMRRRTASRHASRQR